MIEFLRYSKAHIFVDSLDDSLRVEGEDHHHLSRVLRLRAGLQVSAASKGTVRSYHIADIDSEGTQLEAIGEPVHISEDRIEIFVSFFAHSHLEIGIQKAVETGATKICIGVTKRSAFPLDSKKKEKLLTRFQAIARNAAMQSRRAQLVDIDFSNQLITDFCDGDITRVVCDPDGEEITCEAPIRYLIGPEGGFEADELADFEGDIARVTLSDHILRAETAMCLAPALTRQTSR